MTVRESDNMKQWVIFFLFGVVETAKNSIQVFKDIITLKENLEREALPYFSTSRQENAQTLMRHLYQTPMVSIKDVATLLSIKTNTASALITDFYKQGVLYELTGKQRNRKFWFKDYVIILNAMW